MADFVRNPADSRLLAAKRLLQVKRARDSLIAFTRLTMPDPSDPADSDLSRYDDQYFHRALAQALEDVEAGIVTRLIITFPPRHGKSELTSRRFPSWFVGRNPYRNVILGTYNQDFADDFGRDVRAIMLTSAYKAIFPGVRFEKGSTAANRLKTEQGGNLFFVGRGGTVTGRGGDLLIIDDPLKGSMEADSAALRDDLWKWFNDDLLTRLMDENVPVIVIQTRWHEDDLVGRLTDPKNPNYSEADAKGWKIFNVPALAEDNDVLGRERGEPLWPTLHGKPKFGVEYLKAFKARNPRGFNALYQQRPTPEDGEFFKAKDIRKYNRGEAPFVDEMTIYAASDHAVATKQHNDKTCLLVVGVDKDDVIWVLDCVWGRWSTDAVVEKMIALIKRWRPLIWYSDKDHVSKSIGPFLRKRMREERAYVSIREVSGYQDKRKKAQSIQGRMAMGMVMFPAQAGWLPDAIEEMLKFDRGSHDDFVDTLAHLGLGLGQMTSGAVVADNDEDTPKPGTWGWLKASAARRKRDEDRINFGEGGRPEPTGVGVRRARFLEAM